MIDKQTLVTEIRDALSTGEISEAEIRSLLTQPETPAPQVIAQTGSASQKLSAVEVMFYIAGIVLFASIMSMIAQSWETGNAFIHVLLSAGVGAGLWLIALYLSKQTVTSDIRKGLENAIVLTGSLCVIVGGFIITNELIGGFEEVNFIPGAVTFALLGAIHLFYDKLVRKDYTILMGVLLSVATFPALLFGILENADVPFDVWSMVFILSTVLLVFASRILARIYPDRASITRAFDSLAAFLALGTMFVSSFSEYGIFWLALLIASVFGLFYASIIARNKNLLGNASLFMVLAVLTISFRYFSGAGVTVSLVVATLGLLGSAAVATNINKKYFPKTPAA